jgi:FixJ family two-component response regulator
MQSLDVVLLQGDARVGESLAAALSHVFGSVQQARSIKEFRSLFAPLRKGVAILDIEAASLAEVHNLSQEFPHSCIVCTHRLADEDMWVAALQAGALDVCASSDIPGIIRSALTNSAVAHSAAA